jgi:hypothetical protein
MLQLFAAIKHLGPSFMAIFGTTCAIAEFFLSDKNIDKVRDFFLKTWSAIDDLMTKCVRFFHTSVISKPVLIVFGIVDYARELGSLYRRLPPIGLELNTEFIRDAIVVLMVATLANLLSWAVLYKHVIKPIVDRGFQLGNPMDVGLYFYQFNLVVAITLAVFGSSTTVLIMAYIYPEMVAAATVLVLACVIPVSYVCGFALSIITLSVIYYLLYGLIWFVELTIDRVIDFKKGPVIAISLLAAACGVVLQLAFNLRS